MAKYFYRTNFHLTNPVNDFDAAQEYLSEDDMAKYLKNDIAYYKKAGLVEDDIESIDWYLVRDDRGYIELITNKELNKEQLDYISEWVRGQNSDGLGEGFEQQDFAAIYDEPEDDWGESEYIDMASFDWASNHYPFKLVRTVEASGKAGKAVNEAEKLKNSVLGVRFNFEEPVTNDDYSQVKAWFEKIKIAPERLGNSLLEFPANQIKSVKITDVDKDGFFVRIYTKVDLNTVTGKELSDLVNGMASYVYNIIEPGYQEKPFGQSVRIHKRELMLSPKERFLANESRKAHKGVLSRKAMKYLKESGKGLNKAHRKAVRHNKKAVAEAIKDRKVLEAEEPTESNPMKIDAPRGEYWVWMALGDIYGSAQKPDPSKNIVDARATINFSQQGFDDLDEVIDYVMKYF